MPMTALAFKDGDGLIFTGSPDYSYNIVPISDFSIMKLLSNLVYKMAILFMVLIFIVDYIY